jgi:6-phosphogluconate dehydrogenase (decarboxylating)
MELDMIGLRQMEINLMRPLMLAGQHCVICGLHSEAVNV